MEKMCVSEGSSPHTRGAPCRSGRPPARHRDHPRIRGEHYGGDIGFDFGGWDHPRIRGEHVARPALRRGHRGIIPAYAGSTSSVRRA